MEHLEHKVRRIGTRGKGGAALITAIVFVFFLMLFGLAFYRLGETDIDLFDYDKNLAQALYASEAGIDKVRWMLRESHKIPGANPFSGTYNEQNALAIANPTGGHFFPGEVGEPYFKVTEITAELLPTGLPGSRVKIQAFGSVDVDADGEAGVTPLGGGKFDPDPEDVTRKFEAYIGLPGTLGERIGGKGISAGAKAFYLGVVEALPSSEPRQFVTPDGDSLDGFLRFGPMTTFGVWDQWDFIFSNPLIRNDEIELPPGIFDDTTGKYIDEDTDTKPDYFQHLSRTDYTGDQTFTSSPDPTGGRSVVYVNGNIIIDGVDFGYLDDQGAVRNCDWDPTNTDLAFIANGDITVNRVDCGNVGRLLLVAKNITFVGDYDTKVNGIAIAFNDITLNGSGCTNGILTRPPPDDNRPVRYTAYYFGSMVAGNYIRLQSDGWTVIHDENVINGQMYSTFKSKPTLTYERVEASDFNSSNNWRSNESTPELLHRQGIYTPGEIIDMEGDFSDPGEDTTPEVMRVYTDRPRWEPKKTIGPQALGETLSLDFTNGDFEDPDIPDRSLQNWDYYDTITFWMALDNFKRTSTDGTKSTRREARYQIRLRDSGGNTISIPLEILYPESEWGTVRYHHTGTPGEYMNEIRDLTLGEKANETYSNWKKVKITPNNYPGTDFDFGSVVEFDIRYVDMKVSWTVEVGKPDARVIWYNNDYFRYIDENDVWESIDGKLQKGNPSSESPDDGYYYLYYDYDAITGIYSWVKWIEDPNSSTELRMREEVLMPTLRIDRLELPGKPATNNHLEYGLPHCLRLEITNWHEF